MADALPDPPVPQECDCRNLPYMPVRHADLLASDFMAISTGDEFKGAFRLWQKAWNELPAGSLSNDERSLAAGAGVSLTAFREAREMLLYGFVECSDGRLYHPVICEIAVDVWTKRRKQSARSKMRWHDTAKSQGSNSASRGNAADEINSSHGMQKGMQEERREREEPLVSSLRSESNALNSIFEEFETEGEVADGDAWKMAVGVLVEQGGLSDRRSRSLVGKLVKDFGLSTFELAKVAQAARKAGTRSPEPYLRQVAASTARDRGNRPERENKSDYWPPEIQRAWLVELKGNPLSWRPERGPAPGLTGCKVEPMLLAEFGFALGESAEAFE